MVARTDAQRWERTGQDVEKNEPVRGTHQLERNWEGREHPGLQSNGGGHGSDGHDSGEHAGT